MSKISDRQMQQACEPFERDHDRLRAELMASLPDELPGATRLDETGGRRRLGTGALSMRRRIVRLGIPAVAAAAVILVVGLWPSSWRGGATRSSDRVYALSDVPALLHSARVLHLHSYFFVPGSDAPPGTQRRKIDAENWLDTTNGRWHIATTDQGLTDGSPPSEEQKKEVQKKGEYRFFQWISDGDYRMELSYAQPVFGNEPSTSKTAEFSRLTTFQRQLGVRHYYPWATESVKVFEDAKALGRFAQVGRETFDGVAFDIWESEQDLPRHDPVTGAIVYDGLSRLKIRVWLSPALGTVRRVEYWGKQPESEGQWVNTEVVDKIERDVVPPPGIFETVPPPGYTLKNTKETAPLESIADNCNGGEDIGDLQVRYHIGFNLADGTVLLGWSSRDPKDSASQAPLFEGLSPGGPLPNLPIEIHTLVPANHDCDLTYVGRHLAWTRKGERFYEWSLFVPNRDLTTAPGCVKGLELQHSINSANLTATPDKLLRFACNWVAPSASIKDATEFGTFVLGAMAELSDSGIAPAGVTYDSAMQLSRQIRSAPVSP